MNIFNKINVIIIISCKKIIRDLKLKITIAIFKVKIIFSKVSLFKILLTSIAHLHNLKFCKIPIITIKLKKFIKKLFNHCKKRSQIIKKMKKMINYHKLMKIKN